MVHKVTLLALLSLVCLSQASIVYPTFTFDGWDTIFLDAPSFLFYLSHSFTLGQLYIFGGDHLRIVTTGNNFSVVDHAPAVDWHQEFVSIHTFHNGTDLWAIGPTNPSDYTAHPEGYDLPIAIAGPEWHTLTVQGLQGFILVNVYVDERNTSDVLSYMVGWVPVSGAPGETVNQVALGVVRLHTNFNVPYAQRNFTFNYTQDVVLLALNTFSIYSSHYKPHLHLDNDTNILIVVDPVTDTIYTVQVGPGDSPMSRKQSQQVFTYGNSITSSFYHEPNHVLYVGFAGVGLYNGSIVGFGMGQITPQFSINLGGSLNNPRAITIDEVSDTIYVGFNGGDAVVSMNYLLQIQGYQRVPDYLYHIEAARDGGDHVYFITNEQHSKVARVHKQDFCKTNCPYWGYCKRGKCECGPDFQLSSDGKKCEVAKGAVTKEKGAAVALGVLFALTFILAAVGWVLYWRARSGGYVKV